MRCSHVRPAGSRARLGALVLGVADVLVLAALMAGAPAVAGAQQEERPITFDTLDRRMTAITPMLAERMKLAAPAWPVAGEFREARLYAAGDGAVLVAQRRDGTLVRYPLDAAALAALRSAVETAITVARIPTGEPNAYVYTEIAGSRFARRQLLLGATLYGPLVAGLTDGGMGTYLVGASLPYMVALGVVRDGSITRAQADLGMDAGPRFALLWSFAYRSLVREADSKAHAGAVLAGSLAGTAGMLVAGKRLADGEGAAMISGSNYSLAVVYGLLKGAGALDKQCREESETGTYYTGQPYTYTYRSCRSGVGRGEYASFLAAGLAGYPLGLAYVRGASYAVTAGDVRAMGVGGGIGALAGAALASGAEEPARWHAATAGLVLGLVAGDRLLAKSFDYTRGEGTLLTTGAVAGGLLGLGAAADADEASVVLGSVTLGAALGAAVTHQMAKPRVARSAGVLREASRGRDGRGDRLAGAVPPRVQLQLDPGGLAMAAARAPGRHGILSLTF